MDILSRIMAIASLFFVLTIGVQVYPMDPEAKYPAQDYDVFNLQYELFGFLKHEIIAKIRGEELGSVIVRLHDPFVVVEVLSVEPAHRRKGVACFLMDQAEQFARKSGCTHMKLRAFPVKSYSCDFGLTPEQRVERCLLLKKMYEKCGFQAIGDVSGEFPIKMVKYL